MGKFDNKRPVCIDCGFPIARNGKSEGARYQCSRCGADYRDEKKSTITRLNDKLNRLIVEKDKIQNTITALIKKQSECEAIIAEVKYARSQFDQMIKVVKTKDHDKDIVVEVRNEIKETLKLK
jgi:transposase-like protein